jgi:hypothetical protein
MLKTGGDIMIKNSFYATFGGFLLIVATVSCSPSSPTQSSNSSPTEPLPLQVTSTSRPSVQPTSTPQAGLKQEWTIKTGDIQYIGVAFDGTIYGVGPNLYAVISRDSTVVQTNEVDLTDCLRTNFSGGSGDTEIDRWFFIKPDGVILTTTFVYPCMISPGNPPTVEKVNGDYFPYADDNSPRKTPSTPNGFTNNFGNPYLYFSRLDGFDFFVNLQQKTAAFVDHNGEIRYFDFPENTDLERHAGEVQIAITPWDDVYLSYPTYDALGNKFGQNNMKIEQDGTSKPIESFPHLVKTMNDMKSIANLSWVRPIYLPERNEVYFYQRDSLTVYDLDFNFLENILLPSNFPEISYGTVDSTKKLFVGHDGSVYVFDTSIGANGQTLTKYSVPSNTAQIPSEPTLQSLLTATPDLSISLPQTTLDQEAILFRNQALQIINGFETVEYSMTDNSIDTKGNVRATRNASLITMYDRSGNIYDEQISVNNTHCARGGGSGSWSCFSEDSFNIFLQMQKILEGNSSSSSYRVRASGSNLDSFNGINCRSFFVEGIGEIPQGGEVILLDKICFDLTTYYPLSWVSIITSKKDDAVLFEATIEKYDFKFNVVVEEIVLPEQ